MIEYYGWVSLSDSTYESDENKMRLILDELSLFILSHRMNDAPGFIKLNEVNGSNQLLVSGNTNHLSQDVIDVIELYNYIAKIAIGSYGLLYIRNDENSDASNEFEVFVLARGNLKKEKDHFLSPCIPVIEDVEE
ncbi:Imm7 family immunity protein [Limnobaculum xujianqingii]|uniref:Imm7 family immunity protein n=1 Tax=Limnobaculum xujianqingii TaxID=2738837 RepID=UPI001126549B|nr:Imm7 family immunity protein [Limnobaculum xujianqingii]